MPPHWKYNATRCAIEGCENARRKGWTTCGLIGHYERGVSLYGLAPKAPRLKDAGILELEAEQEARDAALDAAEFNDPREQERLQHEADLRYEYSKPEYHDEY